MKFIFALTAIANAFAIIDGCVYEDPKIGTINEEGTYLRCASAARGIICSKNECSGDQMQRQYAACISYASGDATYRCAADVDGGCEENEVQLPNDSTWFNETTCESKINGFDLIDAGAYFLCYRCVNGDYCPTASDIDLETNDEHLVCSSNGNSCPADGNGKYYLRINVDNIFSSFPSCCQYIDEIISVGYDYYDGDGERYCWYED